jgi:serum/glucocorticoid-regulated kinase 2
VEAGNPSDTQNFDDAFLEMDPILDNPDEQEPESQTTDSERERTDEDKTDGEDSVQTPAQSRSPSVHPVEEESVDVFDGYSFKGRQSVLIDDDELEGLLHAAEQDKDGEGEEEEDEISAAILTEPVSGLAEEELDEEVGEEESIGAKTPEAKPALLPQVSEADEHEHEQEQEQEVEAFHNEPSLEPQLSEEPEETLETNKDLTGIVPNPSPRPSSDLDPREDGDAKAGADGELSVDDGPPSATHREDTPTIKLQRRSKERSALPPLESLSQLPEQKAQPSVANEEDDEIDDWDLVEAPGAEHQNGTRAPTLFARGVVDRYRLAVFRKTSSTRPKRPRRYFSGNSTDAETELNSAASPTPSEKDRRGRNPGLSLRAPKQFLRAKSPPSFSPQNSATSRSNLSKSSATMSGTINSLGGNTSSFSLKSKPSTSTVSVAAASGTPSDHSEPQSPPGSNTPGGVTPLSPRSTRPSFIGEEHSESKIKKMKKNYKEGAEKVLSLFGSPRS